MQKQIVATDMGLGVGRFFGTTLVSIDIGEQRREAVHVALRGMLKMATFELLENLHDAGECREIVADVEGVFENDQTQTEQPMATHTNHVDDTFVRHDFQ